MQNGLCNPWVEVCRSAIRYCKLLFRGAKSAIRYALFENRWPPLWAPSDLGWPKRNTYATFFSRLHSRSTPSDSERKKGSLLTTKCPCCIVDFGTRVIWRRAAWLGFVQGRFRACVSRPSQDDESNKLPQIKILRLLS